MPLFLRNLPKQALIAGLFATGWVFGLGIPDARALEGAPPLVIRAVEPWGAIFGDRDAEFRFSVASAAKADVQGSWRLTAENGVLASRETILMVEAGKLGTITVQFKPPAVRPGIILPLMLSVRVQAGQHEAKLDKRLWIFPDDPFALQTEWLRNLKLTLFDPRGETSRRLRELKVPFDEVPRTERAAALEEGILIVGEGLSWAQQRHLPEVVLELAERGVMVLALAPAAGSMPLPGANLDDSPSPVSLQLRRTDMITELDKRLDALAWPSDGKLQSSGLEFAVERGRAAGRFVEGTKGWPWLECSFEAPRGRLIVCGFSIIRQWDEGPTPRYLFAHILERLAAQAPKYPSGANAPDDDTSPRNGRESDF